MGNNSVPKFIFCLSRFPVYRGSVLGRFYCIYSIHDARSEKNIKCVRLFVHYTYSKRIRGTKVKIMPIAYS